MALSLFRTADPLAAERKALMDLLEEMDQRPNDVKLLMRAGELEHKLGRPSEAAIHYANAALRYATEGFVLRAVAVNKIAYGLTPVPELLEQEAVFYAQLDLLQDAFESLKRAISIHTQRGYADKAAAARRKLLDLDPDSAAGHVAIGEEHIARGRFAQAIESMNRANTTLTEAERADEQQLVKARLRFLELKVAG